MSRGRPDEKDLGDAPLCEVSLVLGPGLARTRTGADRARSIIAAVDGSAGWESLFRQFHLLKGSFEKKENSPAICKFRENFHLVEFQ